jgi:hypothetical protein
MPRKSAASAEITALLPGAGRLEPPSDLAPAEARAWRDIADALPGHWIDPGGGQAILRRVVAQVALAEHVEGRIRELLAGGVPEAKELASLTLTHSTLAKSIALLLGVLRATPKSRLTPRDASQALTPSRRSPATRPWEVRATVKDDPVQ